MSTQADDGVAHSRVVEVVSERRPLPTWAWLLALVPVLGWIVMLAMVVTRSPVHSVVRLDFSGLDQIGRVRTVRRALLALSVVLIAVGIVGRVVDTDWAPAYLMIILIGIPSAWFVTRLIESVILRERRAAE